jgi:hypothetical protein
MPMWEKNSHAKIHEGCGGLVRWVEAIGTPGVHYTGECLECDTEGIPTEQIIPIETRDGSVGLELYNDADLETLRDLEWDEDDSFDENQERLHEVLA